ncbi:MAG: hypothetical protein LBH18_03140, partial [Spirochaetaceae bacterium]|nr:hypothetical protein [Spirochaetaceae bacterium]
LFLIFGVSLAALVFAPAGCEHTLVPVKDAVNEDAEPDAEDLDDNVPEEERPAFTGAVLSLQTGMITKNATRQFIADTDMPVTWAVTGGSEGGGTSISDSGLLSVGRNEANITLHIRAESGGAELGTATVKVKSWKDLSAQLSDIFAESYGVMNKTGITAAAYGNGIWVIAGHSANKANEKDWMYPAAAWSDDNGATWHKANYPAVYEDYSFSIAYGGPAGNEKFVLGCHIGRAAYSSDGKEWTLTRQLFKSFAGNGSISRNALYRMAYGELEGGGLFVAAGASEIAYSPDGVDWIVKDMELDSLCYGTGIAGGKRVGMFMGKSGDDSVYSTNGADWTTLAAEAEAALSFIPSVPNSGYSGIKVQPLPFSETDSNRHAMFKRKVFTSEGDGSFSLYTGGKYVPYAGVPGVYVHEVVGNGYQQQVNYDRYVKFVVPGGANNSLYMAFGAGHRAAIAHAEAFE